MRDAPVEQIVIGLDDEPPSLDAVRWVAERSRVRPLRALIVAVTEHALTDLEELEHRLRGARAIIEEAGGQAEVMTAIREGAVPEQLLALSEDADLMVIGRHRRRPWRSALTGWRPLRIVARSRCATVVVSAAPAPPHGRIVVGVADDASEAHAIEWAAHEARRYGAMLVVVHAWRMPEPATEGSIALLATMDSMREMHRRVLSDAVQRIVELDDDLDYQELLVEGHPVDAMLRHAQGADLLVVGTHHRGLLAGAFLGSVGQDLLADSPIPVCVVPVVAAIGASPTPSS